MLRKIACNMTLLLLGKKVLNMPRSSSLISLDFRVVKFIRLISKKDNEGGTKRLTISVLE